jgi:hypothetical protein
MLVRIDEAGHERHARELDDFRARRDDRAVADGEDALAVGHDDRVLAGGLADAVDEAVRDERDRRGRPPGRRRRGR